MTTSFAQQAWQPGYWIQPNTFNPATAGVFNKMAVNASNSFPLEGPSTNFLLGNYNQSSEKLHGGIGFTFSGQYYSVKNTFKENYTDFQLNYSYHLPLKNESKLAFGIGVGLKNLKRGWQVIDPTQGFVFKEYSGIAPKLDLGVLYSNKAWNVGVSISDFLQPTIDLNALGSTSFFTKTNIMADYAYSFNDNLQLKTNLIIGIESNFDNFIEPTIQLSPVLNIAKKFWVNPSIGASNDLFYSIGAGYDHKNKIRFGVFFHTFDYQLNNANNFNRLQVNLSYRIKHDTK